MVGVFQPTLGKRKATDPTRNGLRQQHALAQRSKPAEPFQGCELISLSTQGWLKNANPGLED
jgi:hypothetical protein